jgi:NADH-ubiquinone oxidoreductase chain 4
MILIFLVLLPFLGIILIATMDLQKNNIKTIALIISIIDLFISLFIYIIFDYSNSNYQFVQEINYIKGINIYMGIDGISLYFVLLTTLITPLVIVSNWNSIVDNVKTYMILILLLEMLLFLVFGMYGSYNKVRASFYLFLYTLLGSLFLLLSILYMLTIMGVSDFDILFKSNLNYTTQLILFCGIFIAFAVKTPVIFLNNWLLKAHVESPLGGSIILAAIVLKLSLYGVFRLILPIIPKASINYTYIVYMIGVITIIYASISTLRTIDIKELIAYSSVSHAAVYLLAVFSNTIQGLEGSILLGLGHGFVSSGLFICVGGILYDRSHTRLISIYKGLAQLMPLFSILFFILCLSNAGTPLSLNFIGEFLSLYGIFERLPILGIFASTSIIFSAAYTIYMFNRIVFGGNYSRYFLINIIDLTKREFLLLFTLTIFTVVLGVYPAPIIDGLNYSLTGVLYTIY